MSAFVLLVVAFTVVRWMARREPWNSDDLSLFREAMGAAEGRHWTLGTSVLDGGAVGPDSELPGHAAFRIGLLPLAVPAIRLFGPTATAYYLVPFIFSLIGFCALFWVAWRQFGPTVALGVSVVHLIWPFELEHGSLYLTDLPAAVASLLSLCLLDASARRSAPGRLVCTALAGIAAWETYLLRNNGLFLLGPAFLVLLWNRDTRRQTLWAIGIAALGVLSEQLLLVWRGLGWGYDWLSVRRDFVHYAPFLPVYSWPGFLVRQFSFLVYAFGHGITGWLAALITLGSVGLHLLLLRFERRPLLLAIVVFGLCSWLVYNYSIYERVPGGVRATVPINFRFYQPFAYSSLLAWTWAAISLYQGRLGARLAAARLGLAARCASVAIPALLVLFSVSALRARAPEMYRNSNLRQLALALPPALAGAHGTATVVGLTGSLRLARLFCCGTTKVEWREVTATQLATIVEQHEPVYVLRDIPRELSHARYLPPEEREAERARFEYIDTSLWRETALLYLDSSYALFGPLDVKRAPSAPEAQPEVAPASVSLALDSGGAHCASEPDASGDGGRLRTPERAGPSDWCTYVWPADSHVLPARAAGDDGFALRLNLEYDVPMVVTLDVLERSAQGTVSRRLRVPSGTSYVALPPEPFERTVALSYRIRNGGAGPDRALRAHRAEWRDRVRAAGVAKSNDEP